MIRIAPGHRDKVYGGHCTWLSGIITPKGVLYVTKKNMGHASLLASILSDKQYLTYQDHPLYTMTTAAVIDGHVRLVNECQGTLEVEVYLPYYDNAKKEIMEFDPFIKYFTEATFNIIFEDSSKKWGWNNKLITIPFDKEDTSKGFSLLDNPRRKRRY